MEQGDHYLPPIEQTAAMEELAVFVPISLLSLMWILLLCISAASDTNGDSVGGRGWVVLVEIGGGTKCEPASFCDD